MKRRTMLRTSAAAVGGGGAALGGLRLFSGASSAQTAVSLDVVVDSADSAQLFTSADGSESFDVDLVAGGALDAGSLTPSSGERATDVTIEARLRVLGGDTVLARDSVSDVATVTIERDAVDPDEYGSIGGSGSLSIEIA